MSVLVRSCTTPHPPSFSPPRRWLTTSLRTQSRRRAKPRQPSSKLIDWTWTRAVRAGAGAIAASRILLTCSTHPGSPVRPPALGSRTKPAGQLRTAGLRLLCAVRQGGSAGCHDCVVAAVLSRHGSGTGRWLSSSVRASFRGQRVRCRSCSGRLGGCTCWRPIVVRSRRTELRVRFDGTKNIGSRHGRTGFGEVSSILSGSERVQPATLERFADRFARLISSRKCCGPHTGWQRRR